MPKQNMSLVLILFTLFGSVSLRNYLLLLCYFALFLNTPLLKRSYLSLMDQAHLKLSDTSDKLCWHCILSSIHNTSENVKSIGVTLFLFSSTTIGIICQSCFTLWPLVPKSGHSGEKKKILQTPSHIPIEVVFHLFICWILKKLFHLY